MNVFVSLSDSSILSIFFCVLFVLGATAIDERGKLLLIFCGQLPMECSCVLYQMAYSFDRFDRFLRVLALLDFLLYWHM